MYGNKISCTPYTQGLKEPLFPYTLYPYPLHPWQDRKVSSSLPVVLATSSSTSRSMVTSREKKVGLQPAASTQSRPSHALAKTMLSSEEQRRPPNLYEQPSDRC